MHGFCPPITMGGLNLKICQNFVGQNFFLYFLGINLDGGRGVKIIWREQYLLLHFHYFIYLDTASTRKSNMFL